MMHCLARVAQYVDRYTRLTLSLAKVAHHVGRLFNTSHPNSRNGDWPWCSHQGRALKSGDGCTLAYDIA